MLNATEDGGATWNIPLDRVALLGWADEELRLELAGAEVSFLPEDADTTAVHLVPALLARRTSSAAVAAPAGPVAAPPAEAAPPDLTVDLTDRREPAPVAPRPASRPASRPAAMVAPPLRPRRRLLFWLFVVAAMALGAFLATQLGRTTDPAETARLALADAGLPAVTVAVENGTATLSGDVPSREIAETIAATVAGVDGVDTVTSNLSVPAPTPTTVPSIAPDPTATARNALADAGLAAVAVNVESGVAVLSGTVASEFERRAAVTALAAADGVDAVDNQLAVAALPDDSVESAAREALDSVGFDHIAVSVQDGVAIVAGTVPPEMLSDGFFSYSGRVEDAVLPVAGVAGLTNRLQLAGDEATLRRQLRDLTDASPVVFALGRADLSDSTAATLDSAAEIIQAQPGLRVLIAGHTDTIGSASLNEQLSGQRAQAVRSYLIEQGIAANRLLVVAYGELFPTTPGAEPADRRVEFEVAG
jgi:outer membrane protein OmpA-like peptidoglycan-associated protein